MTVTWSADKIASLLRDAFAPQAKKDQQQSTATIDVLLTFDSHGVSSHPNHISLYHGARAFLASLKKQPHQQPPVDLYTLTSVGFARKYAGILDVFFTLGTTARRLFLGGDGAHKMKEHPPALVFMHGFGRDGWATAREAMTAAHRSQMVWFRYGWITLSRYMFMNDLRLEKI